MLFTRNWLAQAKSLCSPKDAKNFGLDNLDEEINILEKKLSEEYQEIGFCHNDLQYGNIMMEEETKLITIIVSCVHIYFCINFGTLENNTTLFTGSLHLLSVIQILLQTHLLLVLCRTMNMQVIILLLMT